MFHSGFDSSLKWEETAELQTAWYVYRVWLSAWQLLKAKNKPQNQTDEEEEEDDDDASFGTSLSLRKEGGKQRNEEKKTR